MATFSETHTKQLQELVTCAICLDYFQDPRILPCSHTFCFQCIKKSIKNGSFDCPLRDNMKLGQRELAHLPINRTVKDMVEFAETINLSTKKKRGQQCDNCDENEAINWCDKCSVHYCESCTKSVHSMKAFQSHTTAPLLEKLQSFCPDHSDEKFKYWCNQCQVLVCRDCLLFQHKDHISSSLKDAASAAKKKFCGDIQEIVEIKQNLKKISETTNRMISGRQEEDAQEKQYIEQTFDNLQRMLDERKHTILKQFKDTGLKTIKSLNERQNSIDQHLSLTTVQELCIKKMLDSDDPLQILRFKSTLSHNYKDFIEQYEKINEGYTIQKHTFEKDNNDVEQILKIITKVGSISSTSYTVKGHNAAVKTIELNISKPNGETKLTGKSINVARGYKFALNEPYQLIAVRIQSEHIGQHIAFVVDDTDTVISTGTITSNDSVMRWLTIPLKSSLKNNYSILVWIPSGNGSYAYKEGNNQFRAVNENCSVESKYVRTVPQTDVGCKIPILQNTYSIDMILLVEE